VSCTGSNAGFPSYQPGANKYGNLFTDQIALFQTAEGGTSRMLMCKGIRGKGGETGRVFGERGWMEGDKYRGAMKKLPNIQRPPLPPGVKPGGHGGSHGQLTNEFVLAILQDRAPLVNVTQALKASGKNKFTALGKRWQAPFAASGPSGASHKRCLSPFLRPKAIRILTGPPPLSTQDDCC